MLIKVDDSPFVNYPEWKITHYDKLYLTSNNMLQGGSVKLINQITGDILFIDNDKVLRHNKWYTSLIIDTNKRILISETKLEQVLKRVEYYLSKHIVSMDF